MFSLSIKEYLEKKKPLIDKEIEKTIPRKITKEWLEKTLGKARYEYDLETATKSISLPIWDFLDRGGKRWRPALVLLACEAVGGTEKQALPYTPLPELVHNGCLTEDAIIWMADGAPKKISDVKVGEKVLSLDKDFSLVERAVQHFHENGEAEVLRIKTRNQEIFATENHPFLIVSKSQPIKFKITSNGRAVLEEKLYEKDLTISEFCEKINKEINSDLSTGHLKNALYGFKDCLLPKNVIHYVSTYIGMDEKDCFEEVKCRFDKAEVKFEWKKANELKTGDMIVVAKKTYHGGGILPKLKHVEQNPKDRYSLPMGFTLELAQLCGFLIGDGYIERNYNGGRVTFCIPANAHGRKEYEELVEKTFGAKPTLDKNAITCCSKAVAELFIELRLKEGCLEKELHEWVFKLPESFKKAFIKGYIDADGTVTKNGTTRFACANKKLMVQFKFLLDSLGFVTSNIREKVVDNTHFGEKAKKKETVLHTFELSSRNKVLSEIGTEIPVYKARLGQQALRMVQYKFRDAIPNWPKNFDREVLGFNKITLIEKAGTKKTYDLQIEETHNYISNGIVTHNTIAADDIEDDSKERRGKPCMHHLFGIDLALNASNIMYFLPLTIFYNNAKELSIEQKKQIYDLYAQEMIRVSVGQATDIFWHKGKKENISEEQYLQMCLCKTGVLARLAAKLGAIIGKGSREQINSFAKFGESLGVGFQIQDDILEISGGEFAKGKGILGGDIHEGKRTLMVIHALSKLNEKDKKRLLEILNSHPTDQKTINEAINLIKKHGSIGYAKQIAEKIVEEAWKEIEKKIPNSKAKQLLKELADYSIGRKI